MPRDWLGRQMLPPKGQGYRAQAGKRPERADPPPPPKPSEGGPTSAREIGSRDPA
jgi:hypothetical protein